MIRRIICRQNCKEKVFLFIAEKDMGYPRRNESGLPPLKDVFYCGILRLRKESVSQGLKPVLGWVLMSGLKSGPISGATATATTATARG